VDTYKPATITGARRPPAMSWISRTTASSSRRCGAQTSLSIAGCLAESPAHRVHLQPDINGIYYINANLPAPQTAFTGVDARPRWTANRIYNAAPNVITRTIVMKNPGRRAIMEHFRNAFENAVSRADLEGSYSYGDAKNTIDPGSTAFSSWNLNETPADPNNPGLGRSKSAQGNRVFLQASYTHSYFAGERQRSHPSGRRSRRLTGSRIRRRPAMCLPAI
jgi:hypothetical protein